MGKAVDTSSYDMTEGYPKYVVSQFTYEQFLEFWPEMQKELNNIRPTWRHWNEDYIHTALATNKLTLWGCGSPPLVQYMFFLQVNTYPDRRVLCVPLAFGTFKAEMMPLLDATIEQYARIQGCEEIEIRGRRGWQPHLKKIGFRHEYEVWTRSVTSMRAN